MTWIVLNNASSGATRNSGTNGDLTTLLDWALPQAGWAIEYTSGNARVYRPGSGIRNRLHVNHDSAVSGAAQRATVRGCEDASAAATLVDPFPTVAQVANGSSCWLVSSLANTTDRPFIIMLNETFVYYFSQYSGTTNIWEGGWFGDPYPGLTDPYGTIMCQRNNSGNSGSTVLGQAMQQGASVDASPEIYWMRDITGATKSSTGALSGSGINLGLVTGTASARAGYGNRSFRERIGVTDLASTTSTASSLSIVKRGWLPNVWNGIQNGRGTIDDTDTFQDIAYNPSALFRQLPVAAAASSGSIIIETSDTWSPP